MKMKKIAAASLAVCVCALSGMSALADVEVMTTTGYDYNTLKDYDNAANKNFTVKSTVTGVTNDKQVTYLVWDGTNEKSIAYIDQQKVADNKVEFVFTADAKKLYPGTMKISAKFGTDDTANATGFQQKFEFNEGVNVIKNGNAFCTKIGAAWGVDAEGGKAFCGTVSGNVKEYGVKIGDTKYPAAGSTNDGKFCVIIKGLTADEALSAAAYAE